MTPPRAPRHRPPWWPENEDWPPQGGWHDRGWGSRGWERWGGRGWGGPGRHGFWRPFGCLLFVLLLLMVGVVAVGIWALAALVGVVPAHPLLRLGGVVAVIVIGVLVLAAGRAMRRMTAPIDDLVDASERIEQGDFSVRVAERGARPMRSLARAFNSMSSRLADQDARRRTFLADVSHELRTPLSVIRAGLEAISDGVNPADEQHLAPLLDQTLALDRLIDDLRTVALADAGALTLERKPTDLAALIEDSAAALRTRAESAGVSLEVSVESGLPQVSVDGARIRQVLANLIGNALDHAPRGGWVRVDAKQADSGKSVEVAVRDNGPGIPADLLPRVFERFVKEPGSRGSGLGLAIARDLVVAHGGEIAAESPAGGGTTVRFTLPPG